MALEPHLQAAVPVFFVQLGGAGVVKPYCVVVDDVDAAERSFGALEHPSNRRGLTHVRLQEQGLAAGLFDFCDHPFSSFDIDVGDGDRRPLRSQPDGGCFADAGGGTGDDGDLAGHATATCGGFCALGCTHVTSPDWANGFPGRTPLPSAPHHSSSPASGTFS